jgi:hypothetical protein
MPQSQYYKQDKNENFPPDKQHMPDPIEVDTPLQVKLSSSRSVKGLAAAHKGICLHAKMRGSPDGEIQPRGGNGARPETLGGRH